MTVGAYGFGGLVAGAPGRAGCLCNSLHKRFLRAAGRHVLFRVDGFLLIPTSASVSGRRFPAVPSRNRRKHPYRENRRASPSPSASAATARRHGARTRNLLLPCCYEKAGTRPASRKLLIYWWSGGGSNSRPSHCERDALPAELPPHTRARIIACDSRIAKSRPAGRGRRRVRAIQAASATSRLRSAA